MVPGLYPEHLALTVPALQGGIKMPTPSFDELLSRARQIGEANADAQHPSTGLLMAKGLSEFASNLLNAKVSNQRTTGGYLTADGTFKSLASPVTTGGTFLQVLAQKARGVSQPPIPEGSFALTPDQSAEFGMKAALENIKGGFRLKTADLRAKAMRAVAGTRAAAATQLMVKEASDYIWALVGRDPETEVLPRLTFGDADRMMRGKGIDTNAELKSLGYEIKLFTDPLFGIPEGERPRLQGKIEEAKNNKPKFGTQKTIRVKVKSTGETGSIPENEFDPNIYERI